ncbi:MAG: hypothetical protein H7246_18960 [Phycisphaerae bacterium]|nr:hypothetical protein [Saprospiraceae bacterium]
MKYILTFYFGLISCSSAFSQSLFTLQEVVDSLPFQVIVQSGKLAISFAGPEHRKLRYLTVDNLYLSDADLLLEYHPHGIPKTLELQPLIELREASGRLIQIGQSSLSSDQALSVKTPVAGRIVWLDATETALELGAYTLLIHQRLRGAVECAGKRPEFSIKQQLPYYGVAAAGLVFSGLGLIFNAQKKDSYNNYRNVWANEGQKTDADGYLADAKNLEKRAEVFMYGGLAVLGANAGFYTWRRIRVRHRQHLYDTYCTSQTKTSLKIEPVLDWWRNGPVAGVRIGINGK